MWRRYLNAKQHLYTICDCNFDYPLNKNSKEERGIKQRIETTEYLPDLNITFSNWLRVHSTYTPLRNTALYILQQLRLQNLKVLVN